MSGTPSILDQYRESHPKERNQDEDREAREFTRGVVARLRRALDEEKTPTRLAYNRKGLRTFINACNWHLQSEMRAFLGFEEKKEQFREDIRRIAADRSLTNAEKKQGIELCRRHIAGINQWQTGFEWVFTMGAKDIELRSEKDDEMDKVATTVAALLSLAVEARSYFGVQLLQEGEDGRPHDALVGFRFPELAPAEGESVPEREPPVPELPEGRPAAEP